MFVNGLGQSRLSWDEQLTPAMTGRFRIVTYDLRGHGDSDKPPTPASYADGAAWGVDLHAVIEQTGLRRPLVVAWSMGGLIVGHYLERHGAGRIAGINLVDAVTSFAPGLLSATSAELGKRLALPDLAVRSDAIGAFLADCFATRPPAALFARMLAYNGMMPRAVQQGLIGITTDGLDRAFAAVPRMLISHGARDALVDVAMSRRMLAINRSARLSIYSNAGHAPFIEDAARFNRELAAFAASPTGDLP
ncbi:alpha/beta fold hydrolase [uncultured Sphingomonas sp.]|uniref:alpha/beta fold hydrolase n=1 Tax=uncultured Sphingomonas sp. TaxID=158754 RepID=UPI0035CB7BAC